ncbi:UvrB/UvrC motif-containing protein [Lagierella sp.]|uniref:UvrB/UvrC motif-containing protein n=1 Tax=Lagierella sp. TaxID=2849657 RepID=UPI002606D1CB|nr:UvrB/UvrC motif-containing protein [Lagierella sp.]
MKCDRCNQESNFEIHFYDGEKHRVMNLCKDCYSKYVTELFPGAKEEFDLSKLTEFLDSDKGQTIKDLLSEALNIKINFDVVGSTQDERGNYNIGERDDKDRCPNCHKSLDEILADGKLGCSECFTTFKDRLGKEFLEKMYSNSPSKGEDKSDITEEKPEKNSEIKILINKIEKKEEALKNSIVEEDFEEAAVIRDEINKLKTDLEKLK